MADAKEKARVRAMKAIAEATTEDKMAERDIKGYIELLETELARVSQLEADKHQYARFLEVCAASGEQPETFEWFMANKGH